MKKILIFVMMGLILVSLARAEFKIVREYPNEINLGEEVEVKIAILNELDVDKEAIIFEQVNRNAELIKPKRASYSVARNEVQYFKWHVGLVADSISGFTYRIKPLTVGVYESAPTKVEIGDQQYFSSALSILVNCVPNGICDSGENYINCPKDCGTGEKDGFCDEKADGICDGDCDFEADIDCAGKIEEKQSFFSKLKDWFLDLFR